MQQTGKTPSKDWKRNAMRKAGVISDAFEVFKAWLAHFANWILFFCLIGNILQTVISLGSELSGTLLCIQCVMLDVAGASLYTMAQHAKSQGNEKGGRLAMRLSILLMIIMTITALNGTLNSIFPTLSGIVQDVNYGLIFARIVIVVAYGNIVHQLNTLDEMHDNRIEELEAQLETEQQTVSNLQEQLNREVSNLTVQSQREVSNLRVQLKNGQQEVSNLQERLSNLTVQSQKEVSNLTAQLDTLRVQLDTKENQLTSLKQTMDRSTKWHEDNVQQVVSSVQSKLENEQAKVSSLQEELSNEKQKVSNLTVQLEQEVSNLRVQSQSEVSNLTVQSQREVSNLTIQLEDERQRVSNLEAEVSNLTVQSQGEVSNLHTQLNSEQQRVQSLTTQLDREKQKVMTLQEKLNSTKIVEEKNEERVIHLDPNRTRRSRQDAEEKAMIEEIRKLLKAEPDLTARAIATQVGCSPTTAAKWKDIIEKEAKTEQVM